MNKRKLKSIVNLHKDGVSCEVCIAIIIDILGEDSSNVTKGIYIHSFYEQIFNPEEKKE